MSTYPATPKPPIFKGMTPEENEVWLRAHNWAYASIVDCVRRLEIDPQTNSSDYEAWFGSSFALRDVDRPVNHAARRARVLDSFGKMASRMAEASVTYEKSSDDANCGGMEEAYVAISSGGSIMDRVISLCSRVFNDHYLRLRYMDSTDWARAFIVVHEMHHVAVATFANVVVADSNYSKIGCEMLATFNPERATMNAQNYAYFAMGGLWRRPVPAPDSTSAVGLWVKPVDGGGWGGTGDSLAAASVTHDANDGKDHTAVIVVWREPEGKGARLWQRVMLVEAGKETWIEPSLLRNSQNDGSIAAIKSIGAPCLVSAGSEVFCSYNDHASGKLILAKADAAKALTTGDWSKLVWSDYDEMNENAPNIATHASSMAPIAVYRPDMQHGTFNQSAGMYCVYADAEHRLKCRTRLDGLMQRWKDVPLDERNRKTYDVPALLVVGGQLKCMFRNEGGHFVTLTYHPVVSSPAFRDCKLGNWQADGNVLFPMDHHKYLTLGELNTAKGPQLIAVRTSIAPSASDGELNYSWFTDGAWTHDLRLPMLSSKFGVALASCGPNLYMFFASADGSIHARK